MKRDTRSLCKQWSHQLWTREEEDSINGGGRQRGQEIGLKKQQLAFNDVCLCMALLETYLKTIDNLCTHRNFKLLNAVHKQLRITKCCAQ